MIKASWPWSFKDQRSKSLRWSFDGHICWLILFLCEARRVLTCSGGLPVLFYCSFTLLLYVYTRFCICLIKSHLFSKGGLLNTYAEFVPKHKNNYCDINEMCFRNINPETNTLFDFVIFIHKLWKDITSCYQHYYSDFILPRCQIWPLWLQYQKRQLLTVII